MTETTGRSVRVGVPRAVDELFTYGLRPGQEAEAGCRVVVPFGQETLTGVVVEVLGEPDVSRDRLRFVAEVLDEVPSLPPPLLELARFVAEHYACPLGEVLRAMHGGGPRTKLDARITAAGEMALAGRARGRRQRALLETLSGAGRVAIDALARRAGVSGVRSVLRELRDRGWVELVEHREAGPQPRTVASWRLAEDAGSQGAPQEAVGRSEVRAEVLDALRSRPGGWTAGELSAATGRHESSVRGALQRLVEAGLVLHEHHEVVRSPEAPGGGAPVDADRQLSRAQSEALAAVERLLRREEFGVLLLEGVTGSGKTEVYLRALADVVSRGGTGLYLVPEISITPLLLREVRRRFGRRTAVLHSGLSAGERHDERQRILAGEVDVVVGARSAVFAPLPGVRLVIVDEEHESSYKQDSQPRYHGRDVAVVRARLEGCPIVLGSATPSLETYRNARSGRYELVRLPERVGGSRRARVEIVDMRTAWREARSSSFSKELREALDATLAAGRQAMVLINRRGWAEFLLCRECGEPERCHHCAVTMTVHLRDGRLECHYCGDWRGIPSKCRSCAGTFLQNVGRGTEQVEEELVRLLPGVAVARLDADVARRRGAAARVLAEFEAGRTQVLLGTQVIAKGHDFPGVTLVGVLQADRSLWLPDFRAAERTFQLLVQVAGRAGRRAEAGRVIVQTHTPDHPAMTLVEAQDYPAFYEAEASLRRASALPPFAHLVAVLASGEDLPAVESAAGRFADACRAALGTGGRVLGPAEAPIARIKDRHRVQVLLRGPARRPLGAAVREGLRRAPPPEGVTLDVDVDPQSLL